MGLALAGGAAQAQSTPGAGSSVTGGQAAPAVQPGTGTRNTPDKKDDAVAACRPQVHRGRRRGRHVRGAGRQLAASKATDAQVKSFASMLVDHHTAANNELVKLANAKGVELPPCPQRGLRNDIDKLGKRNGADFDAHFVREVGIEAHEKDIKMFEQAGRT